MRILEQFDDVTNDQLAWANLKESHRIKKVLYAEAIGLETLEFGGKREEALKLNFDGVHGYLLKSRIDNYDFRGLTHFLGKEFEFVVETIDVEGHWFLANRIQALEVSSKRFWKAAKVGQVVAGFIKGVDVSNLYLSVEGVSTVLHKKDVSYSFTDDLRIDYEIGDLINVKITKLEEPSEENEEEGLLEVSAKVLQKDPWGRIIEFKEGSSYTAEITKIHAEHGVFLELIPGLTVRTNFPPNATPALLKKGSKQTIKILTIDHKERRIKAIIIIVQKSIRSGRNIGRQTGR